LGRSEFCRRHGLALSTLNRHLKNQLHPQAHREGDSIGRSSLVEVEVETAVVPLTTGDQAGTLTM